MLKFKNFRGKIQEASLKFIIPEDIPVKERNAFMGAAAAAHKAGKSHFDFGGKKHKVTMQGSTARSINSGVTEGYMPSHGDEMKKKMMTTSDKDKLVKIKKMLDREKKPVKKEAKHNNRKKEEKPDIKMNPKQDEVDEAKVATPQTRGMAGSRGIMRKKTGPRGANKQKKVYEPTRGQLNNIRRRGEGQPSTTKFMDQVRSIAPSVYNHPKVQDIFRKHAETNEAKSDLDKRAAKLMNTGYPYGPKITVLKKGDPRIKAIKTVQDRKKKAFSDLAKKETQDESKLNELSPKTLSNYARGAAMDMGTKNYVRGFEKGQSMMGMKRKEDPKDKKKAQNRLTGIITATDKLRRKTNEDVKAIKYDSKGSSMDYFLGADPRKTKEYKALKQNKPLQKKLDKLYGPKKKVKEDQHDDDGANHIVMQLRKAVTLRGMRPVTFKDGKKVKVDPSHAQKFLTKYNKAKPMDKEKMQAMAHKSHAHFKKSLDEAVPAIAARAAIGGARAIGGLAKKAAGSAVKRTALSIAKPVIGAAIAKPIAKMAMAKSLAKKKDEDVDEGVLGGIAKAAGYASGVLPAYHAARLAGKGVGKMANAALRVKKSDGTRGAIRGTRAAQYQKAQRKKDYYKKQDKLNRDLEQERINKRQAKSDFRQSKPSLGQRIGGVFASKQPSNEKR